MESLVNNDDHYADMMKELTETLDLEHDHRKSVEEEETESGEVGVE